MLQNETPSKEGIGPAQPTDPDWVESSRARALEEG